MPVSVVIGGQFGSEGKGKVAHAFAQRRNASVAVRVGGVNSGHTAVDKHGVPQILRQLPTAALLDAPICVLPAGSYIDVDLLHTEMQRYDISPDRVLIDPNAVVISSLDKDAEQDSDLKERIGSTQSGTGAAVMRRLRRESRACLAQSHERLATLVRPTRMFLRERLSRGEHLIIEGTQGFGLSVLHIPHYPYATSRDTTAAAFLSEAGLSPLDVDEVIMVIRAYPIRVSGHSGDLPNEIDWGQVTVDARSAAPIVERTSVTGKIRRVARFDPQVVREAIAANAPTTLVLNHVDYIDGSTRENPAITPLVEAQVSKIERGIGSSIDFLGFGPASLLRRAMPIKAFRVS